MRCNPFRALLLCVFIISYPASARPAIEASPSSARQSNLAGAAPSGTPAAAGTAAAANALSTDSTQPDSTRVLTLDQAASGSVAQSESTPPIVPAIQKDSAKALDSVAPPSADVEKSKKAPDIALVRISTTDADVRALLKIHGVSRFVEVGSVVRNLIVARISDEGVCLINPDQKVKKQTKHSMNLDCARIISFPYNEAK